MATTATEELKELEKAILKIIKEDSLLSKFPLELQSGIAQAFSKTLTEAGVSLSSLDLNNKDTKDTLKLGCRAEAAQILDPSLKLDMKPLLKPLTKDKSEEKDEDKEANLEKNIFKTLKSMLTLELSKKDKVPTKEQELELEMKLKELARSLSKGKSGPTMMKGSMDALVRELERKSQYGGIDPEQGSGQERAPVESNQGGNQSATQDLSDTGDTFKATNEKIDAGQPDFVGARIATNVNHMANSVLATPEQEQTSGLSSIKSPGSTPKLKPPGI